MTVSAELTDVRTQSYVRAETRKITMNEPEGALFGFVPARNAARLDPIEAPQHE